jgi:hypothetical protein
MFVSQPLEGVGPMASDAKQGMNGTVTVCKIFSIIVGWRLLHNDAKADI